MTSFLLGVVSKRVNPIELFRRQLSKRNGQVIGYSRADSSGKSLPADHTRRTLNQVGKEYSENEAKQLLRKPSKQVQRQP